MRFRDNVPMGRIVTALFLLCGAAAAQVPSPLSLADAEKLAVLNHPALAASRYSASAALEIVKQAHAALEPALTGSVTGVGADSGSRLAAGSLNNPAVYSRLGTGVTLSQLITDFGRTSNLVASARYRAQAEDQASEGVRTDILLATDRAYFDLLRAQSEMAVAQETVKARQLVSDQVTQLAASKLRSQLDVSFANVNLAQAKLQLSDAQNNLNASAARLAAALGLPGQQTFTLAEEPTPVAPPDQVEPLIDEAMKQRPELAESRLQANGAERFAQAEKALRYPSIAVSAAAGVVPAGEVAVPGRYGAIGANVNVPIFNGGLFKARQSEAELRALAANKNTQDLEYRIVRDVRVAWLNALNAYERLNLTAQLLEQARLGLDLAQRRYDLGLSSIVELSQAQLNFTSAQFASAGAKYDFQSQHSLLLYETGDLR